jgi:hypothetical protein
MKKKSAKRLRRWLLRPSTYKRRPKGNSNTNVRRTKGYAWSLSKETVTRPLKTPELRTKEFRRLLKLHARWRLISLNRREFKERRPIALSARDLKKKRLIVLRRRDSIKKRLIALSKRDLIRTRLIALSKRDSTKRKPIVSNKRD